MTTRETGPSPAALKAAIEEAGGTLTLVDPPHRVRAAYRRSIHELVNGDLLGPRLRLRHRGRDRGDLVMSIVAVDAASLTVPPPDPVPVPVDLRGCHPVIRATRVAAQKDRSGWIDTHGVEGVAHIRVHADHLHRCLLILQALVTEGQRRGYVVDVRGSPCGGLSLIVNGYAYELAVKEETARVIHEPSAAEQNRIDRGYGWNVPKWDYLPTGRLAIRNGHSGYFASNLAADRKRWTLDQKLPMVFVKLEQQAAEAEGRHQAAVRAEEERRRVWEIAVASAREDYLEHKRVESLDDQLVRWRQVRDLREFCAAAEARTDLGDDDRRWLRWIDERIEALDPLAGSLVPPKAPEPSSTDLEPFLPRLNALGLPRT